MLFVRPKITEGEKKGDFQTAKEMTAVKPTPKQVSEIQKRTGKSRAEINKMTPAELVSFLPAELRSKIADEMEIEIGDLFQKEKTKYIYDGKYMLVINKEKGKTFAKNGYIYTLVVVDKEDKYEKNTGKDVNFAYDLRRDYSGGSVDLPPNLGMRIRLFRESIINGVRSKTGKSWDYVNRSYLGTSEMTSSGYKSFSHRIYKKPMKRIQRGYKPDIRSGFGNEDVNTEYVKLGNNAPYWTIENYTAIDKDGKEIKR